MVYEFMSDDGELIEASFSMREAPGIGSVVELDHPDLPGVKVKATRIVSRNQQVRGDNWKPYVSNRLPRYLEGVPCTPSGKPIITSRQQERNIMAKFGYERE